ncbi:MerR family transcriptional regulator [Aureimonas flava]|uniref:MerR family transcriptional regulator n=1 Tax=Aureimonas flava TaxID=2320271 RepID=A0A3A1WNN8_9HYPH|nr:MerR family DNA-binding protein [Aureimonas flava]RIY02689.1 MerR family transcriptional regulator [Aureimonas flava]
MADWTIAGLAREAGIGVETVRYYQRRGLLAEPERPAGHGSAGGFRRYGRAEAERLHFIRAAKAAGFTLDEIAELLRLDAVADRERARALAEARVRALDRRIAELSAARDALAHLAGECRAGAPGPCPIVASLAHRR